MQGGRAAGDRHDVPLEVGLGGLLQAHGRRALGQPARLERAGGEVGGLAF